ncbi:MAG: TRAP transporter small permease subunit [Gammaproteobacteria bacterium]|nr:TRAP transporter small permease subunit [Gammaproteobacteria bacterium]
MSILIDRLNHLLGRAVAWLTLAMAMAVAAIVLLRYAFAQNTILIQEAVIYGHGLVLMLGMAYTLKENGHVRVDILYSGRSPRWRALVDLFGHLFLLLPVAALVLATSLPYALSAWRILEGSSEVGGLPGVFLLKTLIPSMAALLLLQGLSEIGKAWRRLAEGPSK